MVCSLLSMTLSRMWKLIQSNTIKRTWSCRYQERVTLISWTRALSWLWAPKSSTIITCRASSWRSIWTINWVRTQLLGCLWLELTRWTGLRWILRWWSSLILPLKSRLMLRVSDQIWISPHYFHLILYQTRFRHLKWTTSWVPKMCGLATAPPWEWTLDNWNWIQTSLATMAKLTLAVTQLWSSNSKACLNSRTL